MMAGSRPKRGALSEPIEVVSERALTIELGSFDHQSHFPHTCNFQTPIFVSAVFIHHYLHLNFFEMIR